MVSLVVGRALIGVIRWAPAQLEKLEASLAVWAGAKTYKPRGLVKIELFVDYEEFTELANNSAFRQAVGRADVARAAQK